MMANVTESLAGRINLIDLYGLSLREIRGDDFKEGFLPTKEYCQKRESKPPKAMKYLDVWEHIWRGFFPEIVESNGDWSRFYSSYLRTYLDRDVSKLAQVGDLRAFERFMVAVAARTGQLLNIDKLVSDVGISRQTADRWLSVLAASSLMLLLPPYYSNVSKRLVKTPKVYFLDTGLASFLIGWDNPTVLMNGAMSGAIFETFVIGEIIKSWANSSGVTPNTGFYFYRDKDGNEIDLLINRNGVLYPIEIKKHLHCDKSAIATFKQLEKISDLERGEGCVVCMADDIFPLTATDKAVGVRWL
jgi:predicted AAA+ superfamily ATPase